MVNSRKFSVSEVCYLFSEVCSQNLLFDTSWKTRLFGYRKHVAYTISRRNNKEQTTQE